MKAMVCTKYGKPDVLQFQEVEKPIPKENEILIKVHATTVTSGDCRVRSFNSPLLLWLPMRIVLGLRKPRKSILGVELAGEVEEVGKNVTRFKKRRPAVCNDRYEVRRIWGIYLLTRKGDNSRKARECNL